MLRIPDLQFMVRRNAHSLIVSSSAFGRPLIRSAVHRLLSALLVVIAVTIFSNSSLVAQEPEPGAPDPSPPTTNEPAAPDASEPTGPTTVRPENGNTTKTETPAPEKKPARQPTPRPIPARQAAPAPAPETAAPATPVATAQGMADGLPAFDRTLLPGYSDLQTPPSNFPHLDDSGSEPVATAEPAATESTDAPAPDNGRGWFGRMYDSIWVDRTVRNGIFLITLIVVFIIYRLRNGRGRKGYL